jgi:hypothetical protein
VAEKLEWVFEGVDRFTGPMGAMSSSIVKFAFGLNQAKDLLMSFGHALEWVGEKGLHFGELAIDALAFKEAALNSFEVMLGTREQAHAMFQEAQAFADLTPFKTADVIGSFQALSATFKEKEVPIVFQAVADVASFAGTREQGQEIVRTLTSDIQRMYAYGKATQRDLIPILNAGRVAGLSPEKWFKGLAEVMGTDVATATAKYHAGMVDANLGTVALLRTIKDITHMELGGAVIKQSQTINGLISTSQSLMENFFFTMSNEVEDIPGVRALKEALRGVIAYFNVLTPSGQRVARALERVFSGALEAIFGPLSGGKDQIAAIMEPIIRFMETTDWKSVFTGVVSTLMTVGKVLWAILSGFGEVVLPVIEAVASMFGMSNQGDDLTATLQVLGKTLGVLVGGLVLLAAGAALVASPIALAIVAIVAWWSAIRSLMDVDWSYIPEQLGDMFKGIGQWFATQWNTFVEWGASIIHGIVEGISGAVGYALDAISGFGDSIMQSFKSKLGIHSPSTVFAEYGANTTEGYVQGIEGGMPDVEGAFEGLLNKDQGSGAGAGGAQVSVTFGEGAFNIDARGGMDAETFARRLQEILPSALAPMFERMALSTGAA